LATRFITSSTAAGRPSCSCTAIRPRRTVWRNVLPQVASQTGRRGIALDLLGFGRSDKPDNVRYTLELHARVVQGFVDALKLHDIVLVADDWGGPLGMYDVVARSDRYQAAILMETFLWTLRSKTTLSRSSGYRFG